MSDKYFCLLRFLFIISLFLFKNSFAQLEVRGTVYDNGKINYVEGVQVICTGGTFAITDTMGHYKIAAGPSDSLYFVYNSKPTIKFPVSIIPDISAFDISIKSKVESKYKVLKEVIVYSKSYKEDSIENRMNYANVFNYHKPGLSSSLSPDGMSGFDLNEIINAFRFRHNKNMQKFQTRLQKEEEEKYVDMRFNKLNVRRITGLQGRDLDTFLVWYRPAFDFVTRCSEVDFTQYILNASYHFKRLQNISPAKKEEELKLD